MAKKITNDPWILQTVEGYKLELFQEPVQISVPNPIAFSDSEKELIQDEINQMLEKCAICEVHQSQCRFLSNLFLVAKKGGGQRPVINLRNLNKYVQYHHFKMEGIHMLKDMINPKDWLAKIDLKDAYFTVPINPSYQQYLCFQWEGHFYQFRCLAFGLASAPRVFTKLMKPVTSYLRRQGVHMIIYLDDMLFLNQSQEGLVQDLVLAQKTLADLGLVANLTKSELTPVQQIEFLGYQIDSIAMTLSLPKSKISKILAQCRKILSQD